MRRQLGYGGVTTFLEDYQAVETVLLVGAHTTFTHPVIWMQIRKRARKGEINLILADPRETDLIKNAGIHINVKPGMDILWIKALGKIILDNGWHDKEFCRRQTIGFEAISQSCENFDIDAACERTGVSREKLEKAAELIHDKRTIFYMGGWVLPSMHMGLIMSVP